MSRAFCLCGSALARDRYWMKPEALIASKLAPSGTPCPKGADQQNSFSVFSLLFLCGLCVPLFTQPCGSPRLQFPLHLIELGGDRRFRRGADFADQYNRQRGESKTRHHLVQPKPGVLFPHQYCDGAD